MQAKKRNHCLADCKVNSAMGKQDPVTSIDRSKRSQEVKVNNEVLIDYLEKGRQGFNKPLSKLIEGNEEEHEERQRLGTICTSSKQV